MLVEQSYALLAPLAGTRSDVLVSDDGRFEVSAQALTDGGNMQMVGATVRHGDYVTRLVFDYAGRLAALSSSDIESSAEALAREDLRRKGVTVRDQQPLLADKVQGPRRTSVLKWGDGLSLRVKRLDDEEGGSWLQLRLFMDTAVGYTHALLTEAGMVVCVVTGRTDQDAWLRLQGELGRQGVEIA